MAVTAIYNSNPTSTTTSDLSVAGSLILTTAASKVIPGATSLLLRNNADSASNIAITDAGVVTTRGNLVAPAVQAPAYLTTASADGAITIPTANQTIYVTKAGVCAMTIVDPTATTHDGVTLTFMSTTANAHTLSNAAGSGFNAGGGATDIGTYGGAKGDNIVITAYQGKWYVVSKVNVTLA